MPPIFYESLPSTSVLDVMDHVIATLSAPLPPTDKVPAEVREFINLAEHHGDQLAIIQKYADGMQKYPSLFEPLFQEEWLDPALAEALRGGPEQLRGVLQEVTPGVYAFPMVTEEFCKMFVEEADSYYDSGLPVRRPNSMNNYGIIVNAIGMEPMISALQATVLQPISRLLFPEAGSQFDGHHAFMVQYKPGEDLGLDMHTDDSDVTFNVCLGKEFTGAGLSFCGMVGHSDHRQLTHIYQHVKGTCVVHLGRKRHGADDIATGERRNLIIWNHSQAFRQSDGYRDHSQYQKEVTPPSLECVSYTHDRDYGNFKPYETRSEKFRGSGWCPPEGKEYEGFEPEATEG